MRAKAEGWAARLDKLDALEPVAFAATDAAVTAAESGFERNGNDVLRR